MMMKRKNKFLSLIVCLSLVFFLFVGFGACKDKDEEDDEKNSDKLISTQEQTLEFSIAEKELFIYSSYQLHVNQTDGVTFASSDDSVCVVDEKGLVYANGFGEAVITAKLGDLQATCSIIVVGHDILPSIQVAQEDIKLVWSNKNQTGSTFFIQPQILFNGDTFTDGEFMSKAKFWQMIGRGTRLCPGLKDGEDKDKFYIFDFCGNFEFFRMNNGKPTALQIALQGAIFSLKAQIAYKLQDIAYQTPELIAFRKTLVDDMVRKVQELNKENFAVRQHLKFVELYSNPDNYTALTYENTLQMRDELAPLITPDADDAKAVRFDALMYGIELAYLMGKKYAKARTDLFKKVSGIASVANIPEIMVQSELINKILHTDYLENAGINEFEHIRENLRDLIKYIPTGRMTYITNFADELISMDWNESELENDDLKNYKMKAEFYIRQNQDNAIIAKLKTNKPLTSADVKALEEILWSELGTKQDYENEYGSKPLGEFVREIVGLDMNAAKEAFAEFLNETPLDSNQIYFVNQIIEYIVHNGLMKDLSVLQDAPFTDNGSIVEVFTDLTVWFGIKKIIDRINTNALAA